MHHNHLIRALPLLASALGRKYGVQVRIGGDAAFTDGNIIQLPSLPRDCDDTLLGLVRGMIDHESAHIRNTSFADLKAAGLTPLEKHIWNTLEDWRVENVLAAIYPGCRGNFQWLIKHLFLSKSGTSKPAHRDPAARILEWLLLTVRAWDVPDLESECDGLQADLEISFPGLSHEIEPVLRQVKAQCGSTAEAIQYARDITEILKRYVHSPGQQKPNSKGKAGKALQSLEKLLATDGASLPQDMGSQVMDAIAGACKGSGNSTQVAIPTPKPLSTLSSRDQDACRQATTALRTRLQAMMQSLRSVRNQAGYTGALNTRKLHSLITGNTKLFLRRTEQQGVYTVVHILIDSSGSMQGEAITLASQACFAVATAIGSIKGINLGVTTFPGGCAGSSQSRTHRTVMPVLHHGQAMHPRFSITAGGGTPMDAALWWVMQQIYPLSEPRKMILLITDGEPDNKPATCETIQTALSLGLEVYGVGIQTQSIQDLLPSQNCRVITTIHDLAPAMFSMLHNALLA